MRFKKTISNWLFILVIGAFSLIMAVLILNYSNKIELPVLFVSEFDQVSVAKSEKGKEAENILWDLPEIKEKAKEINLVEGVRAFSMIEAHPYENVYEIYFGSSHSNHTSRIWTFRVNIKSREIFIYNLFSDEWIALEDWRSNGYQFSK